MTNKELESISEALKKIRTRDRVLSAIEVSDNGNWVKSILVSEIGYQPVTEDIKLRLP